MRRFMNIAIVFAIGFWLWGQLAPFRFARAGIVSEEPAKTETSFQPFFFKSYGLFPREFLINPRMAYHITGRVLHKRMYITRAFFSDILPYDFALGWKGMSDLDIIRPYMTFDHHGQHAIGRYYTYEYHWDDAAPPQYIAAMADNSNKSNNHLIPSNLQIFAKLWWVNTGDIIHLKGYLVDLEWPEQPGWKWKTALTPSENHFNKWDD